MAWMWATKRKLNPDKMEMLVMGPNSPLDYTSAGCGCSPSQSSCSQLEVPLGFSLLLDGHVALEAHCLLGLYIGLNPCLGFLHTFLVPFMVSSALPLLFLLQMFNYKPP